MTCRDPEGQFFDSIVDDQVLRAIDELPEEYRTAVLPSGVRARVAIEAGVTQGWHRWVGAAGAVIGLDHFGASAPFETLYREFGLTAEAVAARAREVLADLP